MVFAVAAVATLAEQRERPRTLGLAAELIPVAGAGGLLEDEVLLDIELETPATLLDADFLSVVVHLSVAGTESTCTVLALSE